MFKTAPSIVYQILVNLRSDHFLGAREIGYILDTYKNHSILQAATIGLYHPHICAIVNYTTAIPSSLSFQALMANEHIYVSIQTAMLHINDLTHCCNTNSVIHINDLRHCCNTNSGLRIDDLMHCCNTNSVLRIDDLTHCCNTNSVLHIDDLMHCCNTNSVLRIDDLRHC